MEFEETIFLTGFPGFIAERLVERLARPTTQFFLLVQPQFLSKATAAVERIAEKTTTPLENFALVEGDVTRPDLGISELDLETIRAETTDVFHLAAAYDLAIDKETADAGLARPDVQMPLLVVAEMDYVQLIGDSPDAAVSRLVGVSLLRSARTP